MGQGVGLVALGTGEHPVAVGVDEGDLAPSARRDFEGDRAEQADIRGPALVRVGLLAAHVGQQQAVEGEHQHDRAGRGQGRGPDGAQAQPGADQAAGAGAE
ncbi:hypothetical protein ATO49_07215 [Mycolicibacterium fortuitum subsp. fortuitum DSM 46621 = ATCC 6841 = JCM 6387]|nr:hypothetical protein ATO49_07215 [Mycolicibacterium fortuitum subsp. fortuitum DSM 46621 = ATCC 6841 = JCM 6387]